MNKKLIVIFAAVVALGIVLALVATLLRSDTPQIAAPTNSIAIPIQVTKPKTFKNDTYGFSLEYPENWYLSGVPLDSRNDTLLYNLGIGPQTYRSPLSTTEDFVPIQVQVYDADPGTLGAKNPVTDIINVNGDRVSRYTYIDELDQTQKVIVVMRIKDSHFLVLRDNDPITYKQIFQAILDSVKY